MGLNSGDIDVSTDPQNTSILIVAVTTHDAAKVTEEVDHLSKTQLKELGVSGLSAHLPPTPPPTTTAKPVKKLDDTQMIIIASASGGGVLLLIIIFLSYYCYCRYAKRKTIEEGQSFQNTELGMYGPLV